MGILSGNFGYGIILQVFALVHFVRRRPDTYWLWIIFIGGGIGALAYIAVEVVPDLSLLRQSFRIASHRKRDYTLRIFEILVGSKSEYKIRFHAQAVLVDEET